MPSPPSDKVKTVQALATALGASYSSVRQAMQDGEITRDAAGMLSIRQGRQVIEARRARHGGVSSAWAAAGQGAMSRELIELKREQAREELELTKAKRMRAQQDVALAARELVSIAEVKRKWVDIFMLFRDRLRALPDQLGARFDRRPAAECVKVLRGAIDDVLREVSESGARTNGELTGAKRKKGGGE